MLLGDFVLRTKPFLKWAGGKRWLINHPSFVLPPFDGTYIEPFLGSAAVFLSLRPKRALLSDSNDRLIETYQAIRDDWRTVVRLLGKHHARHSKSYYYEQRSRRPTSINSRAALFIYLNRACWNGLYRVNKLGEFNVPIGTKDWILSRDDDFAGVADALRPAGLVTCDFSYSIETAGRGDLVFVDPPYTVAHNFNGFVKYNERIFSWDDQIRLSEACYKARERGATVVITNADHPSIELLYAKRSDVKRLTRRSVISGKPTGRTLTTELLITLA